MHQLSSQQLCSIVDGQISGNSEHFFSIISIDSRSVTEPDNSCFFAIVGERNDGHKYIADLLRRGVKTFVVQQIPAIQNLNTEACFIEVSDTLIALQKLARWNREQFDYPVIGITGSNGKTIVKEWLYELLHRERNIVRNPKSYNSQVGVPLSAWLLDKQYNMAILEAGISQPGEMQQLADIIQPTVGIFTNIGEAHQENFSDLKQKTEEKIKLFQTAETIIYCRDHELPSTLIEQTFAEKNLFGWSFTNPLSELYIQSRPHTGGTLFVLYSSGKEYRCQLPFNDQASLENMAHCLAFALSQHLLTPQILDAASGLQPVAMRLEMKEGINRCKLINDYYNSDINSLAIALNFQKQQDFQGLKRKTVILSDIQQSGQQPDLLYREVNQLLTANQIDRLIAIGPDMAAHRRCFSLPVSFFQRTDDFLQQLNPASFSEEIILLKGAREFQFERISSALQKKYHQTVLEINLNRLVDNLNVFKSQLRPETKIVVMVKAFSYGSGSAEIARILQFQQVDYLAVAVADEGIDLRRAGIDLPIIVMNPEEHSFESMIEFRLEPNIYSTDLYRRFVHAVARSAASQYPIHIKIETGMNRLGFANDQELKKLADELASNQLVKVASVFSHLAGADEALFDEFTDQQAESFIRRAAILADKLPYRFLRHLLNSAGIERFPQYQFEMVRLGIGLYGISTQGDKRISPISSLKTTVSQVKTVPAGQTVGYSRKGKVSEEMEIAVLPIGYADGYDRRMSNGNGKVFVGGQLVPVVGNICMDMCMVDVTGLDVKPGDQAEIIGDRVPLSEVARWMGTIPYEVLTNISPRVKRVYIQE